MRKEGTDMTKKKVAVVTGGSRGIGKAVALELAKQGAFVIINYHGSQEKAQEVQAQITEDGGEAVVCQCDVADYEACGLFFEQIIREYGRIDILVNNAGITMDNLLLRMSEEEFDRVIDVNLKGTFNCIRHVSRPMIRQRYGRIVNMASVVGICGNAGQVNYAASKAGIIGMTKSAARELAQRGITVNAIAPGFIETDMTQVLSDRVREETAGKIPLGTFGKPQDVAKAAAFLTSDDASYITGQVLCVDGGLAM